MGGDVRRRVLFVAHNSIATPPWGGVESYMDLLAQSLSDRFDVLYLLPSHRLGRLGTEVQVRSGDGTLLESHVHSREVDGDWLAEPGRDAYLASVLGKYRINLVHFHHLLGHVPSMLEVPRSLGIPSIFSMHDFHLVCTHPHLQGIDGNYCGIDQLPDEECDRCLERCHGIQPGSQRIRRQGMQAYLRSVDLVHVPLSFLVPWVSHFLIKENVENKVVVRGLPLRQGSRVTDAKLRDDTTLSVVIAGHFTALKGANEILRVIEDVKDEPIQFRICGIIPPEFQPKLDQLISDGARISLHGTYAPTQVAQLFENADVSLHYSQVPETFSFTLSEAWQQGVVPIASDLGAFRERIEHGVTGILIPFRDHGELTKTLCQFARDQSLLKHMKQNIADLRLENINEHACWLLRNYEILLERESPADGLQINPRAQFNQRWAHRQLALQVQLRQWIRKTVFSIPMVRRYLIRRFEQ